MATLGILKHIAELHEQNKNRKPMPYTQIIKANPDKKQSRKKIKHYEEKQGLETLKTLQKEFEFTE